MVLGPVFRPVTWVASAGRDVSGKPGQQDSLPGRAVFNDDYPKVRQFVGFINGTIVEAQVSGAKECHNLATS